MELNFDFFISHTANCRIERKRCYKNGFSESKNVFQLRKLILLLDVVRTEINKIYDFFKCVQFFFN